MLYIIISILAGVSIVIARIINSNLAKEIGLFQSTFINYAVGLFFSSIFLLFSKEFQGISQAKFEAIPLWAYSGGLIGVFVVVLSSYITPRISAFYLTLLIFIGQIFAGIIIDYFASGELSIGKIAGGFLVLVGLTYNLMIDRKKEFQAVAEKQSAYSK